MNFLRIFLDEAKRLIKNVSVLTVCIIGPIFYLFLYPSPYTNDIVKPQKIAIIDEDQTRLSSDLAFLVKSSSEINVQTYATSLLEAKTLLEEGEIFGILYIPQGFEKDAYLQSSPNLAFLANSSYFLIYGSIISGLHQATEALNPTIYKKQSLFLQNTSIQKDLLTLQPNPLFNPSLGYINYALTAVFVVILHQMLLVGMGIFISESKSEDSPLALMISRYILFGLLSIILFAFYFGFGFFHYDINRQASPSDFWLFCSAFIFAIVSFGHLFGILTHKPYQATIIILICSLPLVFLLGFIWPSYTIPQSINTIVQFIPIFHGVNALLRLNEMGASFYSISSYFFDLLTLGIFYSLLSLLITYFKKFYFFEKFLNQFRNFKKTKLKSLKKS